MVMGVVRQLDRDHEAMVRHRLGILPNHVIKARDVAFLRTVPPDITILLHHDRVQKLESKERQLILIMDRSLKSSWPLCPSEVFL